MAVAIHLASLRTHTMFALLAGMETLEDRRVQLSRQPDLRAKLRQWRQLTIAIHHGPRQKARYFTTSTSGQPTRPRTRGGEWASQQPTRSCRAETSREDGQRVAHELEGEVLDIAAHCLFSF